MAKVAKKTAKKAVKKAAPKKAAKKAAPKKAVKKAAPKKPTPILNIFFVSLFLNSCTIFLISFTMIVYSF